MASRKNDVVLTAEARERVEQAARSSRASVRERKHARILLLCDSAREGGRLPDAAIAQELRVCVATVGRVRHRFCERGVDGAIRNKEQLNRKARRLTGEAEAHVIALTCSAPPDGYSRWTLRLLKDKIIEMLVVDSISRETIRQTLKKTNLSLG